MSNSFFAGDSPRTTGKHPTFHGIRRRNGKWVAEIREPRKTTRIWLGTYTSPEMAAAAYDVAALALKGGDAVVNFPDFVGSYCLPESPEPAMIRSAAAGAAAEVMKFCRERDDRRRYAHGGDREPPENSEFMDEEEIFDMPSLLVDMAEGMLVSPPPQVGTGDRSPADTSDCDNLWSY